ncbi:diguanylate cyclase [Paenalkalicoccus suaedae]|uniref:Diguanylate cyclase n=1 Tax=Paenalkalicoccus suaedae TaxID=2592382 RepID=A0A859FE88_9BACI|nr:GGDEF domain-containing protein [Paenalkalicoccus suaedae]QKS70545.1 diguanylate cyclase [Paenalkalicoccus suaedae]
MLYEQTSLDLFKTTFEHSPLGIFIIKSDLKITFVNTPAANVIGYEREELIDLTFDQLMTKENFFACREEIKKLDSEESHLNKIMHLKGSNGQELTSEVTVTKGEENNDVFYIFQLDLKNIDAEMYKVEHFDKRHLAKMIETAPSGITLIDMNGKLTFANKMAEEILELRASHIDNLTFNSPNLNITTPDGDPIKSEDLPFSIMKKTGNVIRDYIHTIETSSGESKILSINGSPILDSYGNMTAGLFSMVDITSKKMLELELTKANTLLKQLSERDGLTGVANRRYFDERLPKLLKDSNKRHTPLSIIMFDLDEFKKYNDQYGHQAGDDCLKSITKTISDALPEQAVFARYGGEEFGILLPKFKGTDAYDFAKLLVEVVYRLNIPHCMSSTSHTVTISMGVAEWNNSNITNKSINDLIKEADRALYESKRSGKNRATLA